MVPLETSLEASGGAVIGGKASLLPQQHQQTSSSPSSFPTNAMPHKSPQNSAMNPTSPPPLPYRSTNSTASATTPSNSGHSRNSRGSSTISNSGNTDNLVVSSYSSLATQSISHGKYRQAYEYYQLALQEYMREEPAVVELVNAAATCFNLGALAKKLQEYPQAAENFRQAQEMYRKSLNLVDEHLRSTDALKMTSSTISQTSSSSSCQVCLLQLLVETLQARAHLHYKYQTMIDEAIECHEQVVEVLEDNERYCASQDTTFHRIQFIGLSQESRHLLLITSFQTLGKFYVEKGEVEDALDAYQEALSIARLISDSSDSTNDQRQNEIAQILSSLADIYMQTHSETRDVAQLERLAYLQEDLENWEKALQCWERVLYCHSKEHGEESAEVSYTLGQLARVMIFEGNLEGSLDLYHAAAAIEFKEKEILPEETMSRILELYKELNLIPSALGWLKAMLSRCKRREDQAKMHYEIGRLYLDQGLFHASADSLCLSAELFDGKNEIVHELLEKVECLQGRANHPGASLVQQSENRSCLTAITEDGESALAYEEDFSIDEALKSLNVTMTDESNEEEPSDNLTIGSLVEKAKAMEGEELDALVNSTTHLLLADNRATAVNPAKSSATVHPDPSPSITSNASQQELLECSESSIDGKLNGDNDAHIVLDAASDEGLSDKLSVSEAGNNASETTGEKKTSVDTSSSNTPECPLQKIELYSEPAPDPNFVSDESFPGDFSAKEEKHGQIYGDPQSPHQLDLSEKSDEYESFQRCHDSASETNESIVSQNDNPLLVLDDTPSPLMSTHSRMGLLKPTQKDLPSHKSLSIPQLSSPRSTKSRGRKGYTEVVDKQSGSKQRRRLVKALSSPFRRTRSKSRPRAGAELDPLDEEKEVPSWMPAPKTPKSVPDEESVVTNADAPVPVVAMHGRSDDGDDESLVSQITFRMEESARKNPEKDQQWWWGVTAEGLEGWFPSNYVHQAVEAAEGFLSAKAIHDRVKSRPLDFDSDEESEGGEEEVISLAKDGISGQSKTSSGVVSQGTISKPTALTSQERKSSSGSSAARPDSTNAATASKSEGSKFQSVEEKIEDRKLHLETLRTLHGSEDPIVAAALFEVAQLKVKSEDLDGALENCQEALNIQKVSISLSDACKTLIFMAEVYSKDSRYNEALACYAEAQRLQEATFGYFHEETASTLNRIGNIRACRGEFDLAMGSHKEALRILKECCGENVKHPLVSQTLIQIGAVYYRERNSLATIQSKIDGYTTFIEGGMLEIIGRAHEDRGSYRMAIAFFEEKLQFLNDGDESSDLEDIAETLNSLGMLSCRAGLYLEAIDFYDRALGIQMKLGCDDVQLAMAKVLAGSVQYSLGQFNKALSLFEEALDTLLKEVGVEQETVAATLFHMGVVRAALCNYDEAMSNLQDALDIQTKLLGMEHPATFRTRREIGNLYATYEAELDAAFEEYFEVLTAQKKLHGEKHPNVAETLYSIGCAQAKRDEPEKALSTLEQCYNMRLEFLGTDHPQQASTLNEIAKIQLKRGRTKKALHIVDAALNIRVESLSEQHIDVAISMSTKGSCLVARGEFAEASKLFRDALSVATGALGESHPSVAAMHVQKGLLHLRMCDFDKASAAIQTALDIYRLSELDEDHPGIKEAMEELERVERAEMLCV